MKILAIVLFIGVGLIGLWVADIVYGLNPLLPTGILGLVTLSLMYRNGLWGKTNEPLWMLFVFPRNLKYLPQLFLTVTVAFWAFQQIANTIVHSLGIGR